MGSTMMKREPQDIDYRREFARILFGKDQDRALDLDFVLVQQMFHTSIEVADPKLSVMVGDILLL